LGTQTKHTDKGAMADKPIMGGPILSFPSTKYFDKTSTNKDEITKILPTTVFPDIKKASADLIDKDVVWDGSNFVKVDNAIKTGYADRGNAIKGIVKGNISDKNKKKRQITKMVSHQVFYILNFFSTSKDLHTNLIDLAKECNYRINSDGIYSI
jgi:hypothetical protein